MTHRVGFVVFDVVTMLGVTGPSEVLHQAGRLDHHYELVLISAHGGPASNAGPPRCVPALSSLGTIPTRWVRAGPLDHAQQLLLDGHSVTSAGRHSGLGSDETLRRACARHLGTTPTAYRQRFATAAARCSR